MLKTNRPKPEGAERIQRKIQWHADRGMVSADELKRIQGDENANLQGAKLSQITVKPPYSTEMVNTWKRDT